MIKIYKPIIASAGILFGATMITPMVAAQDEEKTNIVRSYVLSINGGEMEAFTEGVKAYVACYKEKGGKDAWSAWMPQSGNLNIVAFRTDGFGWSELDSNDDEAGEACNSVWEEQVMPHYHSIESQFYSIWTELNYIPEGEVNVVQVVNFDVEQVSEARDLVKSFRETPIREGADGIVWQRHISRSDRWDISLAFLFENFADMNSDGGPNFEERQTAHHGKEKAADLLKRWRENVKATSSQIWRRSDSMGHSVEE